MYANTQLVLSPHIPTVIFPCNYLLLVESASETGEESSVHPSGLTRGTRRES